MTTLLFLESNLLDSVFILSSLYCWLQYLISKALGFSTVIPVLLGNFPSKILLEKSLGIFWLGGREDGQNLKNVLDHGNWQLHLFSQKPFHRFHLRRTQSRWFADSGFTTVEQCAFSSDYCCFDCVSTNHVYECQLNTWYHRMRRSVFFVSERRNPCLIRMQT